MGHCGCLVVGVVAMYEYRARLVRVIDGDSLVLDIDLGFDVWMCNRNVRLLGYNAPEIRGPERPMGLLAKKRLEQLLADRPEFTIATYKDRGDKYGRYLVDVRETPAEALWLVDRLIKEGYGRPYYGGKREPFDPSQPYPLEPSSETK